MKYRLADLIYQMEGLSAREHSLRTSDCPALAEVYLMAQEGLRAGDPEHVRNCDWCQLVATQCWDEDCPSPAEIAAFAEEGDRYVFARALQQHADTGGCHACGILLRHARRHRTLERVKQWARAAMAPLRLPETGMAMAQAAARRAPLRQETRFPAWGVKLLVEETEADLRLELSSRSAELAGSVYQVALLGEEEMQSVRLVLEPVESGGCHAIHSFGPMARLRSALGGELVITIEPNEVEQEN